MAERCYGLGTVLRFSSEFVLYVYANSTDTTYATLCVRLDSFTIRPRSSQLYAIKMRKDYSQSVLLNVVLYDLHKNITVALKKRTQHYPAGKRFVRCFIYFYTSLLRLQQPPH